MTSSIHKKMSKIIDRAHDPELANLDPNSPEYKEIIAKRLETNKQLQSEQPKEETPEPEKKEVKEDKSESQESFDPGLKKMGIKQGPQRSAKPTDAHPEPENTYHEPNHSPLLQKPQSGYGKASVQNALQSSLRKDAQGQTPAKTSETSNFTQESPDAPQRPIPPEPAPEVYRAVLSEPLFQGPMKGSALYQRLQAKSVADMVLMHESALHEGNQEVLKRGDIAQLFRMRNKAEDKENYNKVLRHELAKLRQEARQKVQAIRYQTDSEKNQEAKEAGKVQEIKEDHVREQLSQKLKQSGTETVFEEILMRVLEGQASVPELPADIRARFAEKSEEQWQEFFKNVANMNSAEFPEQTTFDKLMEALYRGIYKKEAQGKKFLVSDLMLKTEGEVDESKYAQIPLNNADIEELFKNLQPGDLINKELLKRLGEELKFIKLAHMPEGVVVLSDRQQQAILHEMRQQRSAESQRNLEKALVAKRQSLDEESKPKTPVVFAGDVFNKKERHVGETSLVMYMTYALAAVAVVLVLFLVLRAI